MWHFVFIVPRSKDVEAEAALDEVRSEFPNSSLSFALEEGVIVLVPAKITDAQAEIMLGESDAVPGSGVVRWFEPWMAKDVERSYRRSEAHRRAEQESLQNMREVAGKLGIKLPK